MRHSIFAVAGPASVLAIAAFALGLIESYGYGWYTTLIWVPIFNVLVGRPGPGTRCDA